MPVVDVDTAMVCNSSTAVIRLNNVSFDINRTMLNTEQLRKPVEVTSKLKRLPCKALGDTGDTSCSMLRCTNLAAQAVNVDHVCLPVCLFLSVCIRIRIVYW